MNEEAMKNVLAASYPKRPATIPAQSDARAGHPSRLADAAAFPRSFMTHPFELARGRRRRGAGRPRHRAAPTLVLAMDLTRINGSPAVRHHPRHITRGLPPLTGPHPMALHRSAP